jgi:seryl-tRNA synthetase
MLDIKFIRENPEIVKEGCQKKQVKINIDKLLEMDKKRREILAAIEEIRAQKNKASKEIVKMQKREKEKLILEMKRLDKKEEELKSVFKKIDKEFQELMFQIPNLPFADVPVGKDENDNVVLREVGERPKFDFEPKDYLELGEKMDIIDVKRAAKVAGTRFGYLKREMVWLEFALVKFAFDTLTKEGFIPVLPPVMLKAEIAKGTGYFEAEDLNEAYFLPKDNLFLIGTAEQSLLAMHTNEVFKESELPKRYIGFSTCFRREAGSWGKDTRGIFRVHQFDKVEMFSFCKPEESRKELRFFLETEEKLMKALGIPYRVVQICTGDLGRPAAEKFDIEAWFPSQKKYRETHSTSNCTDFQARRLNIKYRNSKTNKLEFVHTVNGTAFSQRPILAILENYQQKDGSIKIPEVLEKYLGFSLIKR